VEGGLGLSAWPFFPLYLRQQLEEDNIFSSLHTRIDRASSSSFFFVLLFFSPFLSLLLDLKPLHRSILASLLFFFPKDLASFFLQFSLKLIQFFQLLTFSAVLLLISFSLQQSQRKPVSFLEQNSAERPKK